MSNAQTLDDLRYCADHFDPSEQAESNLRTFAAALIGAGISPPAQKPASVSGDSGAGLVGNPIPTVFPNLWAHLRHPSGCWFTVCGNRCVTLTMTRRHFANTYQRAA